MTGGLVRRAFILLLSLSLGGCAALLRPREPEQPRIAVLEVHGARSPRLRQLVVGMVSSDEYEIVGPRTYHLTARRAGARRHRKADVAKVSAALQLSAVIEARLVRRRRHRARLVVIIRDGASGAIVDRVAVRLRRGRLRKRPRQTLSTHLYMALDKIAVNRENRLAEKRRREKEARERARRKAEAKAKARRKAEARARAKQDARREAEARARAKEKARRQAEAKARAQAIADEKAKKDRQRKAKLQARAEKRQKKKGEEDADDAPDKPLDLETDDRGQVIDDEMPDVLK